MKRNLLTNRTADTLTQLTNSSLLPLAMNGYAVRYVVPSGLKTRIASYSQHYCSHQGELPHHKTVNNQDHYTKQQFSHTNIPVSPCVEVYVGVQ